MFRNGLEPWHIIVLAVIFVVLFGYKRLPDASRSIGRSLRIFKAETKGLVHGDDDDTAAKAAGTAAASGANPPQPAAAPVPPAAPGTDQTRTADQERV
jgi:sec-independent protein translocase protein TatA